MVGCKGKERGKTKKQNTACTLTKDLMKIKLNENEAINGMTFDNIGKGQGNDEWSSSDHEQ